MEHPVPQNVTSFEFHLVGDMTLKQFGYLAAGLGLAYLTYVILMPINAFFALPLIFSTATLGAAFAFLPISDRPLDHWVLAYFKAVYSPTKAAWRSPFGQNTKINTQEPTFKNRLHTYLSSSGLTSSSTPPASVGNLPPLLPLLPRTENRSTIASPTNQPPAPQQTLPPQPQAPAPAETPIQELPSSKELNQLVEMAKQAQILRTKIIETERQINQLKTNLAARSETSTRLQEPAHIQQSTNTAYGEQLTKAFAELQNLVKQTEELYHKNTEVKNEPVAPKRQHIVVVQPQPQVQPQAQARTQPLLTSSPNIVNGIVTDTQGNYLEGVIVIIHNREGMPVRALKTNKLGQFTGATPLPQGEYTITLEKENLEFDTLKVTLNDQVMPPLMVNAKKGGNL